MNRLRALVLSVVCAACMTLQAQAGFTGKWEGKTATDRPIVLDLVVKGHALTGTLTVGKQTADITDGKADEKAFSFSTTIEGRTTTANGRVVGEDVELTVEGVPNPVMLRRAK